MIVQRFEAAFVFVIFSLAGMDYGQTTRPGMASRATDAAVSAVTVQINSGGDASLAQAEAQMRFWFARNIVPIAVWRTWLPALSNYRRHRDVADLSFAAALARPGVDAVAPLLELRTRALLALHETSNALSAAKSYYNVCPLKDTGNALELIDECLGHGGASIRFRADQERASNAAANGGVAPTDSFLKSVRVDSRPYASSIEAFSKKTDRVAYADLLLAADRTEEAEGVFREMFESAKTQAQLTTAIDGIARSLRAEDGNVGRADAWLMALQKSGASPATRAGG